MSKRKPATHFVGFRNTTQLANAVKVFGPPDFIHKWWDRRAVAETIPGDVVIYADGPAVHLRVHVYDDSAHF